MIVKTLWKVFEKSLIILWVPYGKNMGFLRESHRSFSQNTVFSTFLLVIKKAVRNLSETYPKPAQNLPETCPSQKKIFCTASVRNLSETYPNLVRNLSARF